MSTQTNTVSCRYPRSVCIQGLSLLVVVIIAAAHACIALGPILRHYQSRGDLLGGFRLLGSPYASAHHLLLHVDFMVFLIAIVWLAKVRTIWPMTVTLSEDGSLTRHRIALGGILLIGGVLLFWDLGGPILWQDEAQSALISRTVPQTGLPRGTDGVNFFSQERGAEYADGYLWRWHTWLPFYLVAGCFRMFGESAWSARLSAVVLGWLTIPLLYRVALEFWKDRRTALASAGLLSVHVGMILLSRQCRYYTCLSLFTLLSVWGYWRLLHQARWGKTLLVGGMVALFHTHYVYTGICGLAFLSHAAYYRRSQMRPLLVSAAWVAAICAPWVIWFSQMKYGARYGQRTFNPWQTYEELFQLLRHLLVDIVPWMFWLAPLSVVYLFRRPRAEQESAAADLSAETLLGWLTAVHILCLAPIIPAAFYRYLTPVIPLMLLLAGRGLSLAYRWHPALAGWCVAVFLLGSPLLDFVGEQVQPVLSPIDRVISYLRTHAATQDVVAINYGDLPLKFYLPNRCVGGLSGEAFPRDPDWIVVRYRLCGSPLKFTKVLEAYVESGQYERIDLDVPDLPFEHREDPDSRTFQTDWSHPALAIYRRKGLAVPEVHTVRATARASLSGTH